MQFGNLLSFVALRPSLLTDALVDRIKLYKNNENNYTVNQTLNIIRNSVEQLNTGILSSQDFNKLFTNNVDVKAIMTLISFGMLNKENPLNNIDDEKKTTINSYWPFDMVEEEVVDLYEFKIDNVWTLVRVVTISTTGKTYTAYTYPENKKVIKRSPRLIRQFTVQNPVQEGRENVNNENTIEGPIDLRKRNADRTRQKNKENKKFLKSQFLLFPNSGIFTYYIVTDNEQYKRGQEIKWKEAENIDLGNVARMVVIVDKLEVNVMEEGKNTSILKTLDIGEIVFEVIEKIAYEGGNKLQSMVFIDPLSNTCGRQFFFLDKDSENKISPIPQQNNSFFSSEKQVCQNYKNGKVVGSIPRWLWWTYTVHVEWFTIASLGLFLATDTINIRVTIDKIFEHCNIVDDALSRFEFNNFDSIRNIGSAVFTTIAVNSKKNINSANICPYKNDFWVNNRITWSVLFALPKISFILKEVGKAAGKPLGEYIWKRLKEQKSTRDVMDVIENFIETATIPIKILKEVTKKVFGGILKKIGSLENAASSTLRFAYRCFRTLIIAFLPQLENNTFVYIADLSSTILSEYIDFSPLLAVQGILLVSIYMEILWTLFFDKNACEILLQMTGQLQNVSFQEKRGRKRPRSEMELLAEQTLRLKF